MILTAPPLSLDMVAYAVAGRFGGPRALAPDHAAVLVTLMRNHNRPVTREAVAQAVYDRGRRPADPSEALRYRVRCIRKVLADIGADGMIQTVPEGWMLGKPVGPFGGLHQRWLTDEQARMFDHMAAHA